MMKRVSFCVLACAGAMMFNACKQEKDLYQAPEEEQREELSGFEYSAQFDNFAYYQASITSNYDGGRYYAVYLEDPYNGGDAIVATPVLSGRTPIDGQFAVPRDVDKLYVLCDEGVKTYPVGDINISDGTRADALSADDFTLLKRFIDNNLLPEAKYNLKGETLYKSTDLVAAGLEENQIVSVWITYMGGSVPRSVWYYTYTGTEPSIEDCKFYGRSNGKDVEMTFEDIKATGKTPVIKGQSSELNKELKLDVQLTEGQRIGFVYHSNLGWRFTTPSLNVLPYIKENGIFSKGELKGQPWPDDDPVGCKIPYDPANPFVIEHNVFGGAIMHFACNGHEYNIVGFENRLPGQTTQDDGNRKGSYDGDYNDMLFLIRTNPETITPENELPLPELKFTTTRTGVWVFEDTYPEAGDFDFNDVVVYYEIKTCDGMMDVNCWLAAYGCAFQNEVGLMVLPNTSKDAWKNPSSKEVLWKDIRGFKNVGNEAVSLGGMQHKTVRFVCADFKYLRPYLYNGKGACTLETYNTGSYPYAMDIPAYIGATRKGNRFRWSREGRSIDRAYYFLKNRNGGSRSADWYQTLKPGGDTLVVNIPDDQTFFQPIK